MAKEFGIPFLETSAVADRNVKQAFERVSLDVVARLEAERSAARTDAAPAGGDPGIRIGSNFRVAEKKKSGCC